MTVGFWITLAMKPGVAELIEPKNHVLTGANGRECRLLVGLVEKAPVMRLA